MVSAAYPNYTANAEQTPLCLALSEHIRLTILSRWSREEVQNKQNTDEQQLISSDPRIRTGKVAR